MARPGVEAEHLQQLQQLLLQLEQVLVGLWRQLEPLEVEKEAGFVQESLEAQPAAAAGCFSGPAWPQADSSALPSAAGKAVVVVVAGQPVVAAAVVAVGQQELPG